MVGFTFSSNSLLIKVSSTRPEGSQNIWFALNSLTINLIVAPFLVTQAGGGAYPAVWLKGEGFPPLKEWLHHVFHTLVEPVSQNQGNFTAIKVKWSKHQLWRLCEWADYWDDEIITTSKIEKTHQYTNDGRLDSSGDRGIIQLTHCTWANASEISMFLSFISTDCRANYFLYRRLKDRQYIHRHIQSATSYKCEPQVDTLW